MTGTKLCHHCYEVTARLKQFISYPKGLAFVLSCLPQSAEDKYDPNFGDDKECADCGHSYERHFDTYEDMRPVGCKYCNCQRFAVGN